MKKLPNIYHFFSCGELIETVDASCVEHAWQTFKRWGYSDKDCTCIIEYSRTAGIYRKINLKKVKGDIAENVD